MKLLAAILAIGLLVAVVHAILFTPRFRSCMLIRHLGTLGECSFVCPAGHKFFVVLGSETGGAAMGSLRGRFTLSQDGVQVLRWNVGATSLEEANWLTHVGLSARVLRSDGPEHLLSVHPGRAYDMALQLDDVPASDVSLWLCYVTTRYQELRWKLRGGSGVAPGL
jgi:hypothetical protein